MKWARGRMRRLSANCSSAWAHQPATRPVAKIEVQKSGGMPRASYTTAEKKSTFTGSPVREVTAVYTASATSKRRVRPVASAMLAGHAAQDARPRVIHLVDAVAEAGHARAGIGALGPGEPAAPADARLDVRLGARGIADLVEHGEHVVVGAPVAGTLEGRDGGHHGRMQIGQRGHRHARREGGGVDSWSAWRVRMTSSTRATSAAAPGPPGGGGSGRRARRRGGPPPARDPTGCGATPPPPPAPAP